MRSPKFAASVSLVLVTPLTVAATASAGVSAKHPVCFVPKGDEAVASDGYAVLVETPDPSGLFGVGGDPSQYHYCVRQTGRSYYFSDDGDERGSLVDAFVLKGPYVAYVDDLPFEDQPGPTMQETKVIDVTTGKTHVVGGHDAAGGVGNLTLSASGVFAETAMTYTGADQTPAAEYGACDVFVGVETG